MVDKVKWTGLQFLALPVTFCAAVLKGIMLLEDSSLLSINIILIFRTHIATNNGIEFTSEVKCDKTRVFCDPSSKSNTVYGELANSW